MSRQKRGIPAHQTGTQNHLSVSPPFICSISSLHRKSPAKEARCKRPHIKSFAASHQLSSDLEARAFHCPYLPYLELFLPPIPCDLLSINQQIPRRHPNLKESSRKRKYTNKKNEGDIDLNISPLQIYLSRFDPSIP